MPSRVAVLVVSVGAVIASLVSSGRASGPLPHSRDLGPGPAVQSGRVVALVGGTLIDGNGSTPIRNSVVLIDGDRIKAVGQVGTLAVPAGADVISTEGMSVLPGLWDMHVHTMLDGHSDYDHWTKVYSSRFESEVMPAAARQLLMAGVTTARDLGGPLEASIHVRDAINRGEIIGATLYVAGPFIQHEPYPGTDSFRWGVSGAADPRAKVKKIAAGGVGTVKSGSYKHLTLPTKRGV
jgi:hypothetical protein